MHKWAIILILALFATACANVPTKRLAESGANDLSGRQVHIVREASPSLGALTAGEAMLGVFGALAAHDQGLKIVRDNRIQDPSEAVENALARHLRYRHNTANRVDTIEFGEQKPDDLEGWAAENRPNSLVLDVETLGWGFSYFPTVWTRYRAYYTGKVRLIDVETGEVIAQYLCSGTMPEDSDAAPTYEDMMADRAAGLKAMLNARAKACVDEVAVQIL